MKIKIIFLNLLLFFFISGEAFSENYYCKIANTTPKLDLNSLPFKDVGISIDYINKKIWVRDGFKIQNLKFEKNVVSWFHLFNNPVSGKPRITYNYFYLNNKKFIQKTFPRKQNLKASDLVLRMAFQCR